MILLPSYVLLCTSLTVDDIVLNENPFFLSTRKIVFSLRKLKELVYTIYFLCIFGSVLQPYTNIEWRYAI